MQINQEKLIRIKDAMTGKINSIEQRQEVEQKKVRGEPDLQGLHKSLLNTRHDMFTETKWIAKWIAELVGICIGLPIKVDPEKIVELAGSVA